MHRDVLDSTDSQLLKQALTQTLAAAEEPCHRYLSVGSQSTY